MKKCEDDEEMRLLGTPSFPCKRTTVWDKFGIGLEFHARCSSGQQY